MDIDHTKKLKRIIIHPWDGKRIYNVRHTKQVIIDNYPKHITSDFKIELSCFKHEEDMMMWQIDKKDLNISDLIDEQGSLALLKKLEDFTYPIFVQTDQCGNFIEIINHKNWVENWRLKAKEHATQNYDVNGNLEIFQKFYEIILNEKLFLNNKNSEAYWKLLFLNFSIAVPIEKEYFYKDSFFWNIMQLGPIEIKGRSNGYLSGTDFIQHFTSKKNADLKLIEKVKDAYDLQQPYDSYSSQLEFEITTTTGSSSRELRSKRATISFTIEQQFSYKEDISIIINNEIE